MTKRNCWWLRGSQAKDDGSLLLLLLLSSLSTGQLFNLEEVKRTSSLRMYCLMWSSCLARKKVGQEDVGSFSRACSNYSTGKLRLSKYHNEVFIQLGFSLH